MHKIHITEGVVLGKRGVGEANTLVWILTQELGLVRAAARSARVEKSKLRYGLETLTHARFCFVRGKHEWRLVGVEQVSRELAGTTPLKLRRASKITKLLSRLIHGEERVSALYADVVSGLRAIAAAQNEVDADALETVLVLRVLSHLGYLPRTEALAPFIEGHYSLDLSAKALRDRTLLIRTINESLQATGL